MELGVMVKQAAASPKPEAFPARRLAILDPVRGLSRSRRIAFESPARSGLMERVTGWIARHGAIRSVSAVKEKASAPVKKKVGPERLFVGLPLDAVSCNNAVNHSRAIAAGLRALALLGVYGVELPIFWGVVSSIGSWSSYLAIAAMARDAGLRLRVSLHLNSHHRPCLPLPKTVDRAVAGDPDLLFTDRSRRRQPDCLSFAVDDLPVLDGKTPMELYEEFFESFRVAFADLIGSTVTEITIGLGPNGELRYPSFPSSSLDSFTGVGEFQCYDKYMLADLKRHAEESGQPLWGLAGPHDAPEYNQSPDSGKFFKDHDGSWETTYGQFFLSWYSSKLMSHGDRLLSVASKVFGGLPVTLSAKVPFRHTWQNTRSRADQLTAGFFNTVGRNGYDAVAEIFAKYSFAMIVPCMDLLGVDQAECLLSEIMHACRKNGVRISSENSSIARAGAIDYGKIKERFSAKNASLDSFSYQRMGAEFFSPEHWPLFTEFVKSMKQPAMDPCDVPNSEGNYSHLADSVPGNDRRLQAV